MPAGSACGDATREALEADEVVDVDRLAGLHVEAPAAEASALREDDAVGAALRAVDIGGDRQRAVLDVDEHVLRHALHAGVQRERRAVAHQVGPSGQFRVDAFDDAVVDGQHAVLHGLLHEQVLQLLQLRRVLGGEVVDQAEVVYARRRVPTCRRGAPGAASSPTAPGGAFPRTSRRRRWRDCRRSRSTASCGGSPPWRRRRCTSC